MKETLRSFAERNGALWWSIPVRWWVRVLVRKLEQPVEIGFFLFRDLHREQNVRFSLLSYVNQRLYLTSFSHLSMKHFSPFLDPVLSEPLSEDWGRGSESSTLFSTVSDEHDGFGVILLIWMIVELSAGLGSDTASFTSFRFWRIVLKEVFAEKQG